MSVLPVIVYPPSPTGGRRAGLDDIDESDVETSTLIDWRGGGPDVWHAP